MTKAETVNAAELVAETLRGAPAATITQPAPAMPNGPLGELTAPPNRDSLERQFDPLKFKPEKDSLGRWKNLKGGRPPKNKAAPADPQREVNPQTTSQTAASFVAPDAPAAPIPPGPDKFDLAADMYCRAFYATADSIFSGRGEWAPDSDAEHEQLRDAAAAYMRAKGIDDLPPGPALLLAVGTYAAKRIQRPNTNTRWRMLMDYWRARLASWWSGRKIDALPKVQPTAAS